MDKRYVGITGFTSRDEVISISNRAALGAQSKHLFMVGVLASSKTLELHKTKYPRRYPPIHQIASIFPTGNQYLNLIHYHSETQQNLHIQMLKVLAVGGQNCHGLQLNIKWPSLRELNEFRFYDKFSKIVLQVGAGAQEECGNDPEEISKKISQYSNLVNYVLLDPSGGKGEPMDLIFTESLLETIFADQQNSKMKFGIAGGISANNITQLEPLIKKYDVCIDAEGQLRDSDDIFLIDQAIKYLRKGLSM